MSKHVMIDLETLGTSTDAVVASIGLVRFDNKFKVEADGRLYLRLNLKEQQSQGRAVCADTFAWWMQQSPEARSMYINTPKDNGNHSYLLNAVAPFFAGVDGVWGNGADFDNLILGSLFDSYAIKRPWSYSKNRCFRTMRAVSSAQGDGVPPERVSTHHNALDDAEYQVIWLKEICERLDIRI